MRLVVAAVALLLAVPAGATTAGLRGIVMRGPVTPMCQAESPCDAPAKHVTLTFVRGSVSRSVTTGDDGKYLIRLAAGIWTVKIAARKFGYGPKTATVRAGVVRVQNFSIDTGIR